MSNLSGHKEILCLKAFSTPCPLVHTGWRVLEGKGWSPVYTWSYNSHTEKFSDPNLEISLVLHGLYSTYVAAKHYVPKKIDLVRIL